MFAKKKVLLSLSLLVVLAMVGTGCPAGATPATAEPIRIAVVGPMTGDAADYGHWLQRGTFLAADEINKAGGVNGRQIELVLFDDLCQPAEAVMAGHRIATDESIFAVIGHVCSSCTFATQQVFEDAKLTHITPSSTNPDVCNRGFKYQFRSITNDALQGPLMARHAIETLGLKKVAIIYGSEDYARGLFESTEPAIPELGGELVAVETFTPGDKDFSAQLTKIAEAAPEALLYFGHYAEGALVTKQRIAAGMEDVVVIQPGGSQQPGFIEIAGDAAEGVYILVFYDPFSPTPENQKFVESYEAFFAGETPSEQAAYGYEVVYIIAQAIEKGATKETLNEVLHEVEFAGPTGLTKFDERGDVSEKLQAVLIVKNGEMVSWVP
jgi:branched-chain amino acid transport system substrate-binding protein